MPINGRASRLFIEETMQSPVPCTNRPLKIISIVNICLASPEPLAFWDELICLMAIFLPLLPNLPLHWILPTNKGICGPSTQLCVVWDNWEFNIRRLELIVPGNITQKVCD